ncbi:SIMPL domain-containing protein [Acinetobacter nectaris]|uniref:SIMPL domain-containing protein n=1 Tax=Acinetobacter nectaris TaxID=1219382 RepID=UPI001F43CEC3|nr:SIMPL domain-containing protein [Acinetobacter nectaris]MCF9034425.1 SIMPL domain-containing protein [Acinetobacter nectaris]
MRFLVLSALFCAMSAPAFAVENTPLNYDVVNIQADASKDVNNDQMQATLFIEKSSKQPSELANQITSIMNQGITTTKKYPQVQTKTGTQSTYPIYDDNQKLKEWRGRAEIQLQSSDFKAMSMLINELQSSFQVSSIHFNVSDNQRKKVENELLLEASKNFQERANALTQVWKKNTYQLINLNIDTNNNQQFAQPMMLRASFVKAATINADTSQNFDAGNTKITVNANGSIQLK